MKRALALSAVLTACLALPALAETPATNAAAPTEAGTAAQGNLFTEKQARAHLLHLGHADVSNLTKDENGIWHGTATKGGEQRSVAVDVKGAVKN
ncbi:PepSY domain-containing protein [Hyphomicrobium sp. 1Nfss2.1]|uniref:PepSY domain-containing protein n=1 Tax=Hyphomicrobium sp. 1Nfss2.1 TaxID=3413936 RepID=UPI003C7CAE50